MKSIKNLALTLGAFAIAGAGTLLAQTNVITTLIEDDFNRTGRLYGSHPSGGTLQDSVTWQGYNGPLLTTDGSALVTSSTSNRAGFIPISLALDSGIYTLTTTLKLTSVDDVRGTSALLMGFVNETGITTTGGNIGNLTSQIIAGWLFRWLPTADHSGVGETQKLARLGPGAVLSGTTDTGFNTPTSVTFTVVIDTSSENLGNDNVQLLNSLGVATTFLDFTAQDIANIAGIKLGSSGVGGTFEDFSFTVETTIPEPAAVALVLPLFFLGYAYSRRRK